MADKKCWKGDRHPIQTSAVIVLDGFNTKTSIPPPSPPTPCISPGDGILCEPLDLFHLTSRDPEEEALRDKRLQGGLHVLATETAALSSLVHFYETNPVAQDGFDEAVQTILRQHNERGKLIITGVGKSGHIGKKLVATFQSLSVRAVFLHATEALHGDLGVIDVNDTLMFITYSGKTSELLLMLPHLDPSLPTIVVTAHVQRETCELIKHRPGTILLPAPIPESEAMSFGVSAPSTSTTVALALGDALALTVAGELHPSVSTVFAKNHPGGAIGQSVRSTTTRCQTLYQLCTFWSDIPTLKGLNYDSQVMDLFRATLDANTRLLRVQDKVAAPKRLRQMCHEDMDRSLAMVPGLIVGGQEMLAMTSQTTIRQARELIRNMQLEDEEEPMCMHEAVMAVTENGSIIGVLEIGQLFELE